MSKFKVGDRVKSTRFEPNGLIGTVIHDDGTDCGLLVEFNDAFSSGHNGDGRGQAGHCYWCFARYLEPDCDQKIIITTDGTTTLARLYDGKKVVKSAEAKCAPVDTFDFAVGANLAYDRLMRAEPVSEAVVADKPSPEPIKLYCVKDIDRIYKATKGKVYELKSDATMMFDNGLSHASSHENTWEAWALGNPDYAACFRPLVQRPAKVGEWVYITEGKAKGVIGEVLDIDHAGVPLVRHRDVWGMFADRNGMELTRFSISKYLVLDGYQPEPEYYNGKVVCVECPKMAGPYVVGPYTVGKVYTFKYGFIRADNGRIYPRADDPLKPRSAPITSFKDWCTLTSAKFIEYKGEAQ